MRAKFWLLVVVALIISATGSPAALPAKASVNAAEKLPRYEKTECQFTLPTDLANLKVECGYLTVKEDRQSNDANTTKIAVAIAKAQSPAPKADPIVFLNGGPGGRTLQDADYLFDTFRAFTQTRDFIIFDQRGIGYSNPAIECDALFDISQKTIDRVESEITGEFTYTEAMTNCKESWLTSGVKLAAYNSFESAADLNDLRQVLGYRTWNLFGVSYGTRLALVTMRQFKNIRSVVLDSSIPPQIQPDGRTFQDAFEILFRNCSKDSVCNHDYPRLKRTLYQLLDRLSDRPVRLKIRNPKTGTIHPVLVTSDAVLDTLNSAMYSERLIPKLPRMITEAHKGDYTEIGQQIVGSLTTKTQDITLGASFSIGCADHLFGPQLCKMWGIKPSTVKDAEDPVKSNIPTLVLAGEYDPVTPPRYGEETAATLSRSYYLYFPTMGHGPSFGTECARDIMQRFFDAPTAAPDTTCIDQLGTTKFVPADF